MKLRIAFTVVATWIILCLMYWNRAITFAIWTNAALIDHQFPKLTVSIIELTIAGVLAASLWFLSGILLAAAKGGLNAIRSPRS